jgi:hypothetical protein
MPTSRAPGSRSVRTSGLSDPVSVVIVGQNSSAKRISSYGVLTAWRACMPIACLQDLSQSDKMDQACDAMRLNGLVRKAIRLVKGVHIKLIMPPHLSAKASSEATVKQGWGEARHRQPPELFEMAVFSMLPLLKVTNGCMNVLSDLSLHRLELKGGSQWEILDLKNLAAQHVKKNKNGIYLCFHFFTSVNIKSNSNTYCLTAILILIVLVIIIKIEMLYV